MKGLGGAWEDMEGAGGVWEEGLHALFVSMRIDDYSWPSKPVSCEY